MRRIVLSVAVVLAVAMVPAHTAVAAPPIPSSMASTGDSITRGFNACGWYVDCTSRSWSTGDSTSVNSHYLRIRATNSAITGRNYNAARSGAKMADLAGQMSTVVSLNVGYVTILMGANDACTSTEAGMTPVATYRAQLDDALARLKAGLPNAAVFISSIPDLYRLWSVGKGSFSARLAWSSFGVCQSMLANPTSTQQTDVDRRLRVRQRVVDFNTMLAQACAAYGPNCDFDDNAVFSYPFAFNQLSSWDYFHPNTSGQQVLAQVTYNAGFQW
jgi:lysophospholipase L1-like esterase